MYLLDTIIQLLLVSITRQTVKVMTTRYPESNLSKPQPGQAWCGGAIAGGLCPCWFNLVTTTDILSGSDWLSYHHHLVIIIFIASTVRPDTSCQQDPACQDMKNVLQILASSLRVGWYLLDYTSPGPGPGPGPTTWYLQSDDWLAQARRLAPHTEKPPPVLCGTSVRPSLAWG